MDTDKVISIENRFIKWMGEGKFYENVKDEVLEKYKGKFMINGETTDIIHHIWKKYGLRSYKNGLFWLVNPDEYNDLAKQFPDVSKDAIVFARTGVGNLFIMQKGLTGDNIEYLNTHTGKVNLADRGFSNFLRFNLPADSFWKEDCYGKIELKANVKYGQMEADECYTFVPALALGGSESITKMEKVKIKENLELLSQLHRE